MSTTLTPYRCRCGTTALVGDCDYGISSVVDVRPLSVTGEAVAVLTHRRTFDLVKVRARWCIRGREGAEIAARLTTVFGGPELVSILAEHVCGALPLPRAAGRPSALTTVAPRPAKLAADDAFADGLGAPRLFKIPPF